MDFGEDLGQKKTMSFSIDALWDMFGEDRLIRQRLAGIRPQ